MAAPCNFQKIHLLAFFLLTLSLLFLVTSHAAPLSFNYDQLGSDKTKAFNFSGTDVYQDNQVLQLTKYEKDSLGRVTYSKLFHLWDINTSQVTDFTTRFSFTINTPNKTNHGDGITFYLAHPNFPLPVPRDGSGIGLVSPVKLNNPNFTKENPFVAVEFDTFVNEFDPKYDHVGIDVNSISTAYTTQWFTSMDERGYDAEVSYNSSSNNLSVIFTGYQDNNIIQQHLSSVVNLREVLPDWVEFGFTSATGLLWGEYHTLNSWSFNSSLDFEAEKDGTKIGLVIGLSVGGAVVLIAVFGLISFYLWKKLKKGKEEEDGDFEEYMGEDFGRGGPKKYTYAELAHAANNFKDEHKLGQGGFGGVYRGFLKDTKSYVAIKRVSEDSHQGIKEFASEVTIISKLRHRNLVQLIGWCHERKKLLLVYEYMPNGSLDIHLFKKQSFLKWAVRYTIARGLASALLYLHEEWEQCVVHRDIKASNIMLDSEFNAKLGDFGLARFVDHAKGAQTTALAGTLGYMAPECSTTGRASKETDVYSFGIVALEIACGRKPINLKAQENEIHIVDWVWGLYGRGKILEAVDPRLSGDFEEAQIKCLMIVGIWCAHPDPKNRPSIRQAIQVLNFEAPLPNLPSSMPVPTYLEGPLNSFTAPFSISGSEISQSQNIISFSSNTNSSGFTTTTTTSDDVSPSLSLLYSRRN
jgi:serine/threonine protein kinase